MSQRNQSIDLSKFLNICKYGKYIYPASKICNVYGEGYNTIICDYCNKYNLLSSYNHNKMDLCIPCVRFILDKSKTVRNSPTIKSFDKKLPDEINLEDDDIVEDIESKMKHYKPLDALIHEVEEKTFDKNTINNRSLSALISDYDHDDDIGSYDIPSENEVSSDDSYERKTKSRH